MFPEIRLPTLSGFPKTGIRIYIGKSYQVTDRSYTVYFALTPSGKGRSAGWSLI
jgi:hypothetical protein